MTSDRWGMDMVLGERRALQPGRLLWLRSLAWMVAFFFLVTLTIFPSVALIGDLLPRDNAPLQFLSQFAGVAMALGLYALMVWLVEARSAEEIAPKAAPAGLAAGLVIGLLLFAAVMAVMIGFGLYDFAFIGPAPAWRSAGMAIESGVIEEILVRGILLRLTWRAFGPWVAFLFSAAIFGAGHLANPNSSPFAALCIAIEAGIMLGAFYALTGRLWVSIGVHAGWNFTQGYIFGAAVSGGDFGPAFARSTARPGFPEWLTGGAFGPEASLPALILCTAAGVAILYLAAKAGRFDRAPPVGVEETPAIETES